VARAGLVLRKITRPTIEHVLLPVVGRKLLSPLEPLSALADKLFEALSREGALVQPLDAHTLGVREELRGPALAALKLDDAELVRRVHEEAAAFHTGRSAAARRATTPLCRRCRLPCQAARVARPWIRSPGDTWRGGHRCAVGGRVALTPRARPEPACRR